MFLKSLHVFIRWLDEGTLLISGFITWMFIAGVPLVVRIWAEVETWWKCHLEDISLSPGSFYLYASMRWPFFLRYNLLSCHILSLELTCHGLNIVTSQNIPLIPSIAMLHVFLLQWQTSDSDIQAFQIDIIIC